MTYGIVIACSVILAALIYYGLPTPKDVLAWWKRIRGGRS